MENQNKVYQEVAEECSQYCPCGCDHSVKNVSTGDDTKAPSCLNCKHFSVSEQHFGNWSLMWKADWANKIFAGYNRKTTC